MLAKQYCIFFFNQRIKRAKNNNTFYTHPFFLGGGLGGATKGVLLSKTHFFEISVKKSTKMGVPGRKSPWGSPIYPNKPPDDLNRAFLVPKKWVFCEKTPQKCVTLA